MEKKQGNMSVESLLGILLRRLDESEQVRKEGRPLVVVSTQKE